MLENPKKFKYLHRFLIDPSSNKKNTVKMRLLPKDLKQFNQTRLENEKSQKLIDGFKLVRKKILQKGKRSETTEPEIVSPKPDIAMNKLLLKINPMENKKPEVNFPSKKLSPTSSKPQYINKLQD